MDFVFDNTTPIYIQIIEQLKLHIISAKLSPGEKLPSVRELATITKVNPNTMQKALTELEETGLIHTERTNGKFVTEDTVLIDRYRSEYAREITEKYLSAMESIGISAKDAAKYLTGEVNL